LTNILTFSSLLSELPKVQAFWCVLVCVCVCVCVFAGGDVIFIVHFCPWELLLWAKCSAF
jgi:hypothetical protein